MNGSEQLHSAISHAHQIMITFALTTEDAHPGGFQASAPQIPVSENHVPLFLEITSVNDSVVNLIQWNVHGLEDGWGQIQLTIFTVDMITLESVEPLTVLLTISH